MLYAILILVTLCQVLATLPEDFIPSPVPQGTLWEMLAWIVLVGIFIIKYYYDGRRVKKLATGLSAFLEGMEQIVDKFNHIEKESGELKSTITEIKHKNKASEIVKVKTMNKELERNNSLLGLKVDESRKSCKSETSKCLQEVPLLADNASNALTIEDTKRKMQHQVAPTKSAFKISQENTEQLHTAITGVSEEMPRLERSINLPTEESQKEKGRLDEFTKVRGTSESSKLPMEPVLITEVGQIKPSVKHLLKICDSAVASEEDNKDLGKMELDILKTSENGNLIDEDSKGGLTDAVELNGHLQSLREKRKQMYMKLEEETKIINELESHMEKFQTEKAFLQLEISQLDRERQKLQQKHQVQPKLHQEKETSFYPKFNLKRIYTLKMEEDFCKANKDNSNGREKLKTYKIQAEFLSGKVERITEYYESLLISQRRKAHDMAIRALIAERNLFELRKENIHMAQKLIEEEHRVSEFYHSTPDLPNGAFGRVLKAQPGKLWTSRSPSMGAHQAEMVKTCPVSTSCHNLGSIHSSQPLPESAGATDQDRACRGAPHTSRNNSIASSHSTFPPDRGAANPGSGSPHCPPVKSKRLRRSSRRNVLIKGHPVLPPILENEEEALQVSIC